jgi:uncharacterized coiled-coil protein SlyX
MSDSGDATAVGMTETQRIAELEAELAFQGDALRELNEALATQQLDLIDAKRQIGLLGEQLASLRAQLSEQQTEGADERPPHY